MSTRHSCIVGCTVTVRDGICTQYLVAVCYFLFKFLLFCDGSDLIWLWVRTFDCPGEEWELVKDLVDGIEGSTIQMPCCVQQSTFTDTLACQDYDTVPTERQWIKKVIHETFLSELSIIMFAALANSLVKGYTKQIYIITYTSIWPVLRTGYSREGPFLSGCVFWRLLCRPC